MKAIYFPVLLLILFLPTSCKISKTNQEVINNVASNIKSKNLVIQFDQAIPLRMSTRYLSTEYTLKIKGDSAYVNLPYFGVAHMAPINTANSGINYSEQMHDYKIRYNSAKKYHEISFKVKSNGDFSSFRLDIFENGSSTLQVNSSNRDAITFYGEMLIQN